MVRSDREFKLNNVTIRLVEGDITELEVDAIVNAANSYLKHGGGVAAAIVRKGGYEIQRESDEYVRKYGPVPEGGVAVTRAGKLKAKYIIHAVGSKYGDPKGDEKLASAIRSAILKAEELGLTSIALPAISTGVFGYPYQRCAEIMVSVLKEITSSLNNVKEIIVCLYGMKAFNVFLNVFNASL